MAERQRKQSFWRRHSLSLVSATVLVVWIVLYSLSDEHHHVGSFFGNAIADWTGLLVTVLATKWLYERGSVESKPEPRRWHNRLLELLHAHSLSLFLIVTGVGWAVLFARSDAESKWGQVVGNIVSEWTQIFGLVILTKGLIEAGSKESKR